MLLLLLSLSLSLSRRRRRRRKREKKRMKRKERNRMRSPTHTPALYPRRYCDKITRHLAPCLAAAVFIYRLVYTRSMKPAGPGEAKGFSVVRGGERHQCELVAAIPYFTISPMPTLVASPRQKTPFTQKVACRPQD